MRKLRVMFDVGVFPSVATLEREGGIVVVFEAK